jgi:hypothetical protein
MKKVKFAGKAKFAEQAFCFREITGTTKENQLQPCRWL